MAGPIELYLVRHATAAERGEEWPDDTKRPLTPKGMQRFRQVVQGLRRFGVSLDVVLTSPLVRARQTADLLAAGLSPQPPVHVADSLAPGGSYTALRADLGQVTHGRRIACVGHEPDIGALAAQLMGARRPLVFKKGAVCLIELETLNDRGHLAWFAVPRLLRLAGR